MKWHSRDVQLYALAIGAPFSTSDASDLALVTPNELEVFPTFGVLFSEAQSLRHMPIAGLVYDPLDVIYAGHSLEMLAPRLPVAGRAVTHAHLSTVRQVRSGVLIVRESLTVDMEARPLVRNIVTSIIRGATTRHTVGGVGLTSDHVTESQPLYSDAVMTVSTLSQQAILYSLTGDANPLHWNPAAARAAGFDTPILQGLCTYGLVAQTLLRELANRRWSSLRSLSSRFTSPVVPGETLEVLAKFDASCIKFECWAGHGPERRRVLTDGVLQLRH